MLIATVPASPKTAQVTIRTLLNTAQSPSIQVRGIYRDLSRVPTDFLSHDNFHALKGDVSDATSLDFTDVDAVLAITPPQYDGSDFLQYARITSENTRRAMQRSASVRRLVLLSSMGAEHESGTGEIMTNHIAETILKDAAPEVVLARCAYFMENWAMAIPTVRSEHSYFDSCIAPGDFEVPMVAVRDMGRAFAAYLLAPEIPRSPFVVHVQGPRAYSSKDVQRAFEEAVGSEVELRLVDRKDLRGFFASFLPPNVAEGFVEMTTAFLPGGIMAMANEENSTRPDRVWRGTTELTEAIRDLYEAAA
ncbi:hypothetical protein BDV28DRAFT_133155 [Aspergillus coremiiformis]|uniref:NAD(P)-binding domain-containing protein n=1 Tax=Aspergillus coremiiformis TaxID=138285 RepID=A0A5N6ZBJ0_9EURO|nr:hypothetical protein BDV28DRAFT_133155 [Aspergillus coremiiformis]